MAPSNSAPASVNGTNNTSATGNNASTPRRNRPLGGNKLNKKSRTIGVTVAIARGPQAAATAKVLTFRPETA